jgi:leucyl aminopeptidase
MIENFGLKDTGSAGTKIHLMTADDFATWQAKASDAHQGWITAQNFRAKPGKSIYFAANDGRIDFAIGIFGDHAVWDGAALAASLPKGHWQFTAASDDLDAGLMESLALGWGLGQYQFHSYRSAPAPAVNYLTLPDGIQRDRLIGQLGGIYLCRDLINQPPNHMTPAALQTTMETLAKTHDAKLETHSGSALGQKRPEDHSHWQRHHL